MLPRRTLLTCIALAAVPLAGCSTDLQTQKINDVQTKFGQEQGVRDVMLSTQMESLLVPTWVGYAMLDPGLSAARRIQLATVFFQLADAAGLDRDELRGMSFETERGDSTAYLTWPSTDQIRLVETIPHASNETSVTLQPDGSVCYMDRLATDSRHLISAVGGALPKVPSWVTEVRYTCASDQSGFGLVAFQRLPATRGQLASMHIVENWLRAQPADTPFVEFRLRYGVERSSMELRSATEERGKLTELAAALTGSDPRVTVRGYTVDQVTWPYMEV